jgi:small conductance mechanosensitive channel
MVRSLAAIALVAFVLLGMASPAVSQFAFPTDAPAAQVGDISQDGAYLTAPISVDGRVLFRIATSIAPNARHIPIAERQGYVRNAIAQILATSGSGLDSSTVYDPRTFRVEVVGRGDVAVIEAVDSVNRSPLTIVTVTSVDASYNRDSIDGVAAQWQAALQSELTAALELRRPQERAENLRRVGQVALVLLLLTVLLIVVLILLGRRITVLRKQVDATAEAVDTQVAEGAQNQENGGHEAHSNILALSLATIRPGQQLALYRATEASLLALINLMWVVAATWAFSLFPLTAAFAQRITVAVLPITVTILVAIFLDRILDLVIARVATFWKGGTFGDAENRARQVLRIPTIANAIRAIKSLSLVFVAGLTILAQIGVPVGSVVTIGGLTALAFSLAAQSFVRDFIYGILVLVEDQYVVGDYITVTPPAGIPTYSGVVERLTLRVVQLRDPGGSLVTIPHSTATTVANSSRNWSRVNYRVPVDPAADIPKAIDLIKEAIENLAHEPDLEGVIELPIDVIGIEQLSNVCIVIRASVKTAPLRQFEVRRMLNARVQSAFAKAGIAFGAGLSEG